MKRDEERGRKDDGCRIRDEKGEIRDKRSGIRSKEGVLPNMLNILQYCTQFLS